MKYMKYILVTCILLIAVSCEDKSVLSMERGIYYYKQNKINEAMQEFNDVIYDLGQDENLNSKDRSLLARAYYNLGISYAQLNNIEYAIDYINTAISLDPIEEYFNTLNLLVKN